MSVAWGMARDEALARSRSMPRRFSACRIASAASRSGKDANLFISKGDPLEVKTVLTNVFINGQDVGLDNKQEQLYRKYMARP